MLFAVVGLCVLVGAACGGDDEPPAVTISEATTTTTPDAVPTTTDSTPSDSTTTTVASGPTTTVDLGEPTLTDASTVSTVGFDTVTFGLTVRSAEAAAGTPLIPQGPVGDCYVVVPDDGPDGVSFVVTAGTIERVDVAGGTNTTRSGLGIGTPQQRVIDAFPERISVTTSATGSTLTFTPADEADQEFRVIFETDGTTVTSFRSGRVPTVEPTLACQ